jgi:hypothetical protein
MTSCAFPHTDYYHSHVHILCLWLSTIYNNHDPFSSAARWASGPFHLRINHPNLFWIIPSLYPAGLHCIMLWVIVLCFTHRWCSHHWCLYCIPYSKSKLPTHVHIHDHKSHVHILRNFTLNPSSITDIWCSTFEPINMNIAMNLLGQDTGTY